MQHRGVATRHPGYDKYAAKWKRCRDVSDGQDAVHLAATRYLPKLTNESDEDYSGRVKRSNFFNGTWRTLSILNGMLFRKPPETDLPAGIEEYLKDIDLAGTSLDTLAREVALEILEVGRVGLLVDHPPVDNVSALTVAAAQQQGLRPLIQVYRAESIINWKYRRIRNRHRLSMVVLEEQVSEPDGEFAEKAVTQYRVLDLDEADQYRVRVFRRDNERDVLVEGPFHPLMNGKMLDYISFGIVGVDGVESDLDEPPFIDLVDANMAHYQMNSDYRHALHFCPPTFYIAGYQQTDANEKIAIGGTAALVFPDPQARVEYAEPQGAMLPALREALNETKQEMALLGARAIADETRQAETLGATAIKRGGEHSILSAIAMAISDAMEWALGIFAQWAGQEAQVVYQLNRDFMPAMIDAQQLTALVAAVQAGKLSNEEFFALLKRADVIDAEVTFEEHMEKVESEPTLARPSPLDDAA